MIKLNRFLKSVAFASGALLLMAGTAGAAESTSTDDTAKILAGMQPATASPLAALTQDAGWKQHARFFDSAWKHLDDRQISKIRTWSARNLAETRPTLFYMFSGPDFLYADAFFPNASTYVLSGLEPVGRVPDLSKMPRGLLGHEIRQLEASLNSVMSYSFFITKKMKEQLNTGQITGTLPILYVFLARSGKTIESATYVNLDAEGEAHPVDGAAAGQTAKGIKISFSDPQGRKQTLYYFSTDLSNGGLKTSGFLKFCDKLGAGDAFVKSASYLMHSDNFTGVRDYLLAHSTAIVQDDSGIPVGYFKPEWQLRPFGRYVGPISLFAGRGQAKLYEVFRKNRVEPLDFGIGYQWHARESNLTLAVKGAAPIAASEPLVSEPARAKPDREAEAAPKTKTASKRTRRPPVQSASQGFFSFFGGF